MSTSHSSPRHLQPNPLFRIPCAMIVMHHKHLHRSAQPDDLLHPAYKRASGSRNRVRDRSPVDRHPDGKHFYRSRSRQRVPWQQFEPASRHATDAHQQADVTLPKNFPKPLTCFFWFTNGRCSKRDQDCAYAHWNTGHLAGSPITVSTGPGAGTHSRSLHVIRILHKSFGLTTPCC